MENKIIDLKEGDVLTHINVKRFSQYVFIYYIPQLNGILVTPYNPDSKEQYQVKRFSIWNIDKLHFIEFGEIRDNYNISDKKILRKEYNNVEFLYTYDKQTSIRTYLKNRNIEYYNCYDCYNNMNNNIDVTNGYHKKDIQKGVLGEFSKIREEFEELADALEQGNKVLAICELTDLIGAIKFYAKKHNITLKDLNIFSESTENAFKSGKRT